MILQEKEKNGHTSLKDTEQIPGQKDNSKPCQKCHSGLYEIHGQTVLIQVMNGSKQGRDYVFRLVQKYNNSRAGVFRRKKQSASLVYKNAQETLKHCRCALDKKG